MSDEFAKKQTFKEALSEFSNETVFHGVRYIGHAPTIFGRIVWLLLFLLMVGVFVYQVDDRIREYLSWPVTVDITIADNRGQIPFPAVTICNANTFRLSSTYESGLYEPIVQFYRSATDTKPTNTTTNSTAGSHMMKMKMPNKNTSDNILSHISMRTLILKYGHRKNDTVKAAYFQNEEISNENLTTVLTDYGRCIGFNHDRGRQLFSQGTGAAFGLKMLINLEQYQNMDGEHKSAGLKLLVHGKNQALRVKDLGLSVPPLMGAVLDIRAKKTTELEYPYGKCIKGVQRQSLCQHYCYLRVTSAKCKCAPFNANVGEVKDLPYCTLKQNRDCYDPELANMRRDPGVCGTEECPPSCEQLSYDSRISYSSLSHNMADAMARNEQYDVNMLEDYKWAREVQHRTSPAVMNMAKFMKFAKLLIKTNETIKNLSELLHDKQRVINRDRHYVVHTFDQLISHLALVEEGYDQLSKLDRMQSILIPGLEKFKTALANAIVSDSKHIRDFLLNSSDVSEVRFNLAYTDVLSIFRNTLDVVLTAKSTYEKLIDTMEWEIDQGRKGLRPATTGMMIKPLLPALKIKLNSFIWECNKLISACSDSIAKLIQFGESPSLSNWETFHGNISHYHKSITDTEKAGYHLIKKLRVVNHETDKKRNTVTTYRSGLATKYWKYLMALLENTEHAAHIKIMFTGRKITPARIELSQLVKVMNAININFTIPLEPIVGTKPGGGGMSMIALADLMKANHDLLIDFFHDVHMFIDYPFKKINSAIEDLEQHAQSAQTFIQNLIFQIENFGGDEVLRHNLNEVLERLEFITSEKEKLSQASKDLFNVITRLTTSMGFVDEHMRKFRKSTEINKEFLENNFVYVSVYFRTLSLETLVKSKGYLWFSLVCDIGGSAGLYLGASLLAIAEVGWFFGLQFFHNVNHLRRTHVEDQKLKEKKIKAENHNSTQLFITDLENYSYPKIVESSKCREIPSATPKGSSKVSFL